MDVDDSGGATVPPHDPEDWTDEQWLEWLADTDPDPRDNPGAARPSTPLGRVARSSGGQVIGQAMLGIANAMFGRQDDEIVVVAEGDAEPEGEQPFTVHLDRGHPERTTVVIRRLPGDAGRPFR